MKRNFSTFILLSFLILALVPVSASADSMNDMGAMMEVSDCGNDCDAMPRHCSLCFDEDAGNDLKVVSFARYGHHRFEVDRAPYDFHLSETRERGRAFRGNFDHGWRRHKFFDGILKRE